MVVDLNSKKNDIVINPGDFIVRTDFGEILNMIVKLDDFDYRLMLIDENKDEFYINPKKYRTVVHLLSSISYPYRIIKNSDMIITNYSKEEYFEEELENKIHINDMLYDKNLKAYLFVYGFRNYNKKSLPMLINTKTGILMNSSYTEEELLNNTSLELIQNERGHFYERR